MASCFDFRMRASSFDMHQLAQRHKLAKFSKLFRSRSDSNVKTSSSTSPVASPAMSPRGSPGGSPSQQPRRRFMRVVRDGQKEGEEYENPHIIRRYTQEYVEQRYTQMQKSVSMDESKKTLPYDPVPQEDSILKKGLSLDTSNLSGSDAGSQSGERSPPAGNKHASFSDEVEVIEFDKKEKLKKCIRFAHKEKLHDDSDSDFLEESEESECEVNGGEQNNKENTAPPTQHSHMANGVDSKSLKDSSLKDIVNSEKDVSRAESLSDSELEPIKKSSRLDCSDDDDAIVDSKLAQLTKKDEDLISAKKRLAKAAMVAMEDASMATSITKVHIDIDKVIPEEDITMVRAES